MELHLVPLARMTATERPATLWRIDVHVKTDQGATNWIVFWRKGGGR